MGPRVTEPTVLGSLLPPSVFLTKALLMSSSQGSCDTLFEEPEVYAQDEPPTLPPEPGVCHENRRESQDGSSDGTYSAEDTRNCVSTPSKGRKGRLRSTFTLPLRGFSALSGPFVLHGVNRALPAHESAVLEDTASVAAPEEKEDNDIRCVTPAHIVAKKYQRRYTIPKEYQGKKPKIPALQTDFASTWIISDGGFYWQTYESPEGNIYFRETSRNVSIVTFVDLFNKSYREGISNCALILLDMISQQNKKIPKDTEITIILEDHGEKYEYVLGYYLASWEKKCVFWLKDVDVDIVTQSARVCLAESHIGKQVEYLFWLHAEMFPCCHSIPGDVIKQLKRVFNVGVYDHITSDNSIFPYDKSDCNDILKCLERAESSDQDAHDVWVIARCKQNLEEYRFLNYHGERGARTHRLDSIQKDSIRGPRSILFRIITPLLFFMPSVYMREIEGVWIDETVDWISWRKFADMLDKDWNQSMTPAAVILSANLGLLSVNSIDTGHSNRNAVQIASYISSVLSIFFFITVQVLTHQHRSSRHFTAARAVSALS
ncbi:hypothetical protein BDY19DRAFT_766867 [Irpex rosettiformis]|uniref:Uncharacterized protein n=1 Tax=Irpex rosettiformis TaxID=378272 RepID=A0ACB8U7S7_9APHY|nr:hypothetical protein BDY19DRAFT_766867 [Irpex rosettiformis]